MEHFEKTHVLIVGAESDERRQLVDYLASHSADVVEAGDAAQVWPLVRRRPVDVVVATSDALARESERLVKGVKEFDDSIEVVAIVDAPERGHGALEQGAYDFLLAPIDFARLGVVLRHVAEIAELREKSEVLTQQMEGAVHFGDFVTCDPRMIQLFNRARRLARYRAPVIITGERGTGKEGLARALHELSGGTRPMVSVSGSTAGVEELDRAYADAHGGTLFISDAGSMTPAIADRVTALLDRPAVNGDEAETVRIVIAREDRREEPSGDPLTEEIERRIGGARLSIPPLRDRRPDIRVLAREFANANGQAGQLAPEVEDALVAHDWAGNVDELRDVVSAAARAAGGRPIELQDLPAALRRGDSGRGHGSESRLLRDIEVQHLRQALLETHGNKARAARILGLSRWALQRRMQKHGIRMEDVVSGSGGQGMRGDEKA